VGNTEMDLLIVNLYLHGAYRGDLRRLPEYCRLVSEAVGRPIAVDYPALGEDAFRTGTGVHAAAILKARQKGDEWLADRVYSSVPAGALGVKQKIEISPVSGLSNVRFWLQDHGFDPENARYTKALFDAAKASDHVLSDEECRRLIAGAGV